MAKKTVRLTESQLHKVIAESVTRILQEEEMLNEFKFGKLGKGLAMGALGAASLLGGYGNANAASPNNMNRPQKEMNIKFDKSHICPENLANQILSLDDDIILSFEVVRYDPSYKNCLENACASAEEEYGDDYYIIIGNTETKAYCAMAIPKVNNVKELVNYYNYSQRNEHGSAYTILNKDIKNQLPKWKNRGR